MYVGIKYEKTGQKIEDKRRRRIKKVSSILILQALLSVLILGKKGKVRAKEEGKGKGGAGEPTLLFQTVNNSPSLQICAVGFLVESTPNRSSRRFATFLLNRPSFSVPPNCKKPSFAFSF